MQNEIRDCVWVLQGTSPDTYSGHEKSVVITKVDEAIPSGQAQPQINSVSGIVALRELVAESYTEPSRLKAGRTGQVVGLMWQYRETSECK